jgi:diguanylate cyclase (GGDEF)-like protein
MLAASQRHLSHGSTVNNRFSQNVFITLLLYCVLAIAFVIYVHAEKSIDLANEQRLNAINLVQELRQSSDDLTRMARTYVITGEPKFKRIYQHILDIRDGVSPHPVENPGIASDWLMDEPLTAQPRKGKQSTLSLLSRMRDAGFTHQELLLLTLSKRASDDLSNLEWRAMGMITEGENTPSATKLAAAQLLYSSAYNRAKIGIMNPIQEVDRMVVTRTTQQVQSAERTALYLRWFFIALAISLILLLMRTYKSLKNVLGTSPHHLFEKISRIGDGDFKTPISTSPIPKNSVLDWLSQTQNRLASLDDLREKHEEKINRITKLYAALSQCNQAIVRCQDEHTLFNQICQDAVRFGGMKLAWIGKLNTQTLQIEPVAYFGSGSEYIQDIDVSLDEEKPSGQGPIGMAMRSGQPFWVQDFIQEDRLAPWHERGKEQGWQAMAALPIFCDQVVVGSFNIYTDERHAFDEAEKNLLTEMATDIGFAMDNFHREALRLNAEAAQIETFMRLEKIANHVPGMVFQCRHRPDGKLSFPFASSGVRQIYHLEPGDIKDDATAALSKIHPDDIKGVLASIEKAATGLTPWHYEYRVVHGKHIQWLRGLSTPEREADGSTLCTGFISDITEEKKTEERIARLVHFDSLTGLPNRTLLLEHAEYAIEQAQRKDQSLTLMFIDLDHFKNINESLGHGVGDELLVSVANRILSMIRPHDTLSRQGGDEFALLAPICDTDQASRLAKRLIEQFEKPFAIEQQEINITLSIGIAQYPEDGLNFVDLSRHAEIALYQSKSSGRNTFRFFTDEMQAYSHRLMKVESALRRALQEKQFHLLYQPQIDLKTRRIIGAEALIRWRHPELGLIPPNEFIPIAEENGLILPIGDWVLREATSTVKGWLQWAPSDFVIAVNLSAVQFRQQQLPDMILKILHETGLPLPHLELELTESVAMENPDKAKSMMDTLNHHHIKLSMDDFGTGYSSLSYLKRFKLYKLKIDQSFIREMTTDAEDRAIVSTIINMAKTLDLVTIAEGVETEAQLNLLTALECNECQGYLTGKPMTPDAFQALLVAQATDSHSGLPD